MHSGGFHRFDGFGVVLTTLPQCLGSWLATHQSAAIEISAMPVYFKVNSCPLGDVCSNKSFKNAAMWGWEKEECKERVLAHLIKSTYHQMEVADAQILADDVEIVEVEYEEEPQTKRPKARPTPPPRGPDEAVLLRSREEMQKMIEDRVVERLQQQQQQQPPGYQPEEVTEAQADDQLAVVANPGDHVVYMRVGELQAVIDSMQRASFTVRQAQRLASAAARAYADEAANIDSIKADLERTLSNYL